MKSQQVRLIDIFVLAPFMVYSGAKKSTLPGFLRLGLVVAGVATLAYNGNNYLKYNKPPALPAADQTTFKA